MRFMFSSQQLSKFKIEKLHCEDHSIEIIDTNDINAPMTAQQFYFSYTFRTQYEKIHFCCNIVGIIID